MARARRGHKRPYGEPHVPLDPDRIGSVPRTETGPGGEPYTVRAVRGGDKDYRCPGCHQLVPAGTAHVVAWPTQPILGAGLEERRHWHTACWRRA
ncbi:hypothetical protein [Georgenia sp. H159]|uniref:hypothetical protein n=1 Tax=Georgenia sp. H159 TaxID=3076115 RepID=UPI002D796DC0|nr:hypothetical protein [Georgenia sp. H159]